VHQDRNAGPEQHNDNINANASRRRSADLGDNQQATQGSAA
jgi:hypothetical protein